MLSPEPAVLHHLTASWQLSCGDIDWNVGWDEMLDGNLLVAKCLLLHHIVFRHLHSFTSLHWCGLYSVFYILCSKHRAGTQALKSQNNHIIYFFMHIMYGCPRFPESAMHTCLWCFAVLFLLPVTCSAHISLWRMPTPPLRSCSNHLLEEALFDCPEQSWSALYKHSDFILSKAVAFIIMYTAPHGNTRPSSL